MFRVTLLDYILGGLVAIYFWKERHFGNSRCPDSPDGVHAMVTKDCKYVCSYCDTPMDYIWGEDAKGKGY